MKQMLLNALFVFLVGICVALFFVMTVKIIKEEKQIQKDYQCVAGYKFSNKGYQIFSEDKKGIPCS